MNELMNGPGSFMFIHQFMNRLSTGATRNKRPLVTTRGIISSIHVPRVGCHPTRGTWQDLMPHVASNLKFMHVPRVGEDPTRGTGHFTAWFSYHTRSNATRSAPRPAHVPHVACTPHAPPPTWRTCHAWPHTARPAPRLAYVPHVASRRTRRPCATRDTWR